ncbi:MAG TPA: cation:proton antiporter [Gemmatimonadaceae bacterium]|nr:cation:proton antiporter [Gemmatimonadaceae bacterium]
MADRFRRRALCAALAFGFFGVTGRAMLAQSTASSPAPTASASDLARWDSLVAGEQYFVLRDELNARRGDTSGVVRYFRGVLATAMNRPDEAIAHLQPLVPSARRLLGATRARIAAQRLGDSYLRVYRYADAATALRVAASITDPTMDSLARSALRTDAAVARAISDVLPQRIVWRKSATLDTIPNGGVRGRIMAAINGRPVSTPLRMDIGTRFTLLDSTTAASHRVRLLDGGVPARSLRGTSTTARVGVIDRLDLGAATISNVVALVFPDADLALRNGAPPSAILGFPVVNELGRVALARDGHLALFSPGAPRIDSSPRAPMAIASTIWRNAVVAEVTEGDHRATRAIAFPPDSTGNADAVTFDFNTMTIGFDTLPPPPVLPGISLPSQGTSAPTTERGPRELAFIALLFGLFIVPKALQRFRLPGAITSLLMGIGARGLGFFPEDPTLQLLSTLGIVALFLFAGLEIDGRELRRNVSPLVWHAASWTALFTITAIVVAHLLGASGRVAALVSLALVTPSTGFILSSLSGFGLSEVEQRSVKTYAIGSELIALTVLFFVLQSTSALRLSLATAAMIALVVLIPLAFRFFASVVAPYAPRSEFAFLLMVAVVCAYTTRRLGVYYLVGAFVVGLAAQRFRADHPAMSSERMVDALESFGSVFIPFYFFHAGTEISREQLTFKAFGIGLLLLVVLGPVRVALTGLHRKLTLRESFRASRRIGSALLPTLVFTLVIAGILDQRFGLQGDIVGGLVLYTILNTMMPGFALHGEPADFEDVEAARVA